MNTKHSIPTQIKVSVPYSSWHQYATITQEGKVTQYPLCVNSIQFFRKGKRAGDPNILIGDIDLSLKPKDNLKFTFLDKELDKPYNHRSDNTIKRREPYSFIGNVLWIDANAIQLQENIYTKQTVHGGEVDTSRFNFILTETYKWNGGEYTHNLWFDQLDYGRLIGRIIDEESNLRNGFLVNISIEDLNRIIQKLTDLKQELENLAQWWKEATVEDVRKRYALYKLNMI